MKSDAENSIAILKSIRENITEGSDFMWTSYESAEELNLEIDSLILRLEKGDKKAVTDAYIHFVPSSTFQEHSMMNGWTEIYMKLASEFDAIYERNT